MTIPIFAVAAGASAGRGFDGGLAGTATIVQRRRPPECCLALVIHTRDLYKHDRRYLEPGG